MITVCNVLIGHPVKTFDYYYYYYYYYLIWDDAIIRNRNGTTKSVYLNNSLLNSTKSQNITTVLTW